LLAGEYYQAIQRLCNAAMISLITPRSWKESGFLRDGYFVFVTKGAWRFVLLAAALACPRAALAAGEPVSYNNQIGPILSEHCFRCHGPDSASRKPKKHPLRLDRQEFAYESRDDGKPVIIKGDPGASELVRRITATDDDVMPPAVEHNSLKSDEIALIRQWISQGGKYEKHWSLLPPAKPALPADGAGWARNPVDQFVARKLAQNGLAPNPQEHRARLYRRLSFDLTGLPPSPRETEAFVRSGSDQAYAKAVDRMLASDACAEQFTRWWLDAVRYADTQGIHIDYSRSVWPYRDWVIAAFKANMPFDQFTIEQIAGDMLPGATQQQKIASGYNRLLETTSEGGAIPEEYAAVYAKDRVDTTTAVWLGLTAGCATCHDHKFDPITTKDFYALTAFFRNNTSSILDGPNGNNAPTLFLPARPDIGRWHTLEQAIPRTKKAIAARTNQAEPAFQKWLAREKSKPSSRPISLSPALHLPLTESNGPCAGDALGQRIQWAGGGEKKAGPFGPAPLLTGRAVVEKAAPVVARNGQASYGAFIYVEDHPSGAVLSRMNVATNFRGWDLFLSDGRPTVHIIDQFPDKALKITANEQLSSNRWHHLMAVFNGRRQGAAALALYVDGLKAEVDVNNNNLGSNILTDVPLRLGGRSGPSGPADVLSGGRVFLQDVRFYDQALAPRDVARLALAGLARGPALAKPAEMRNAYLAGYDSPSQKLEAALAGLGVAEESTRKRGAITLVMEEKTDTKPSAYVLFRGNYITKGEEVSAATPAALPAMPADAPRNRLGLARWIMSRQDPLVARVTVNRLWSQLFGAGIVETTEDFGVMGARPSNQDLLDWLAVEFMDSGWDFRQTVKTMVMSAAYRQSEAVSPQKLEKDPQNKWLSRGPRARLDAEEIRDQALAASGLLVATVGGPPVKPYQPENVWEAVAMKESDTRMYKPDTGPALYRRSLYTFWKRTAPPPNMEILNAPSRETFCTRRDRTDTPLQALVTLNDTQFVEAARRLAARAIRSSANFDSRLDHITETLLARTLAPEERALVRQMEQDFRKSYQAAPADARALLAVGESKPDQKIPPADLAAWTLVASEILNLDETLTK
jgi:mono/diheme cytochrome c family protein